MSEQEALNDKIQELADQENAIKQDLNSRPAQKTDVKLSIDPIKLFDQLEQLRKEGVDEATIRTAFADYMSKHTGNSRQAKNVMKRHIGSLPMPSQADINKMYEDRYKDIVNETTSPQTVLVLEALENAKNAPKITIPLKTRIARLIVRKILSFIVTVCKLLGVN